MEKKTYSISQIQKIMDENPVELQKLIRKNKKYLNIQVIEGKNGEKENLVDEESLKKLLFLRQLETGRNLTLDEAFEQMRLPDLLPKPEETNYYQKLIASIESMHKEVLSLGAKLKTLTVKYSYAVNELGKNRAINQSLKNEISILRNREAALMGQLQKNAENQEETIVSRNLVN
jgi:hypothetical protein